MLHWACRKTRPSMMTAPLHLSRGQRMQQPRPLMANQVAQVNLRRRGGWHRGSAALALATRKIGTH